MISDSKRRMVSPKQLNIAFRSGSCHLLPPSTSFIRSPHPSGYTFSHPPSFLSSTTYSFFSSPSFALMPLLHNWHFLLSFTSYLIPFHYSPFVLLPKPRSLIPQLYYILSHLSSMTLPCYLSYITTPDSPSSQDCLYFHPPLRSLAIFLPHSSSHLPFFLSFLTP